MIPPFRVTEGDRVNTSKGGLQLTSVGPSLPTE